MLAAFPHSHFSASQGRRGGSTGQNAASESPAASPPPAAKGTKRTASAREHADTHREHSRSARFLFVILIIKKIKAGGGGPGGVRSH